MIVNNLKVSIKSNIILDDISFILNSNDKVGLVGSNGSGKSTLLRVLSGILKKDFGTIKLENETIGYLKQEISHEFDELSILDYIKYEVGIDKLEDKLHKLEANLTEENMEEYSNVLNEYLAIDGYSFEENLKVVLKGLLFNKSLDSKIKAISGGEKIKILLASLLLRNDDILLLDEPTNNLDIEAIQWLENYLKNTSKKIIIVSHDEVFLDKITNKIFELRNRKLKEYNMGYQEYLKELENEYDRKYMEYVKAKEEKDKLKKQVEQASVWVNKGVNKKSHNDNDKIANNFAKERTNSSNVSKLKKNLESIEIPEFQEKQKINFSFDFDDSKGNKDIILNELVCGYETFTTPLINLSIPFGTKLEIMGSNGSGKTTLLKTILCELKPINGKVIIGNSVKIGYISQDTLGINTEDTILEYLTKDKKDINLSMIFILLNKFNINYDDKDKLYKTLSPGQRTRVNLVKIALDKTNVLILDEVTNHLDKEAIDLICELVSAFKGTIISISHNRKYNEILDSDIKLDIRTGEIEYKKLIKRK